MGGLGGGRTCPALGCSHQQEEHWLAAPATSWHWLTLIRPWLPAVKQRMKSVASIQKITKAMKMVAASKMRSAQIATEQSRGIVVPMVKMLGDLPNVDVAKNITVPITTDRGLCGGINTTVCKYARATLKAIGGAAERQQRGASGQHGEF